MFIQAGSSMEYGISKAPHNEKINVNRNFTMNFKIKIYSNIKKSKLNYVVLRLYQIYGLTKKLID